MSEFNIRDKNTVDFLLSRRSILARMMEGPGPDDKDLRRILQTGLRVPDHGRLAPWRFIVIRGEARERLGGVLAETFKRKTPDAIEEQIEIERERLTRAPVVVAVVSKVVKEHKIPEWEQILSSGAACQTMLIAALSMGYAAQWITEWYAYDPDVKAALGIGADDRIAGFLYLGNEAAEPTERMRPEYDDIVSEWTPPN